jgi:hypothetical protein
MGDIRTCFPTVSDSVTGAGECLASRTEGEAAAAQIGSIGFAFKDSSGNVVLPSLTASGAIPVDTEGTSFTCLSAYGEATAPVVDTPEDLATIALTDATQYRSINILVTASRWSLYRVYWVDDVGGADTETDLGYAHVGPGQFSLCCVMPCEIFTSGTTSELRVSGEALQTVSTIRASLGVQELA